jgi:dephospho-CoA kinase
MLIAVLGRKSSGKDTFANYIINKYEFIKYSFADPLKKGIQHFFNLSEQQLSDEKLKETIDTRWGVSPRKLFQTIGTDIFQNVLKEYIPELSVNGRNHWVILFNQWYTSQNPDTNVIIADGRFLHEIEEVKKLGGKVIKIIRPSQINTNINKNDSHLSELEIDMIPDELIDHIIINDSTNLDSFYQEIDKLFELKI